MINKVGIKNYKSIVDLELDLGKINIIIGANGSGKSNILEAIALASAANKDRIDDEYLSSRMRLPEHEFMCPEFDNIEDTIDAHIIRLTIGVEEQENYEYILAYTSDQPNLYNMSDLSQKLNIKALIDKKLTSESENDNIAKLIEQLDGIDNVDSILGLDDLDKVDKTLNFLKQHIYKKPDISTYLIYAPEESNLRKFNDDTLIRPLGRKGEGLFKHLKELISDNDINSDIMGSINDGLSLLDWFEEFEIPSDLFTQEQRLNITDRFLKDTSKVFDQRSTNEGFLFLLFYLTLFNSPKTPAFFAIDNIENALNPKLARRLVQHLIGVAKEKGKQVIFTTHSPYVLDGLDLSDDDQRLFVVDRNIDGHTEVNRISHNNKRTKQLSELWMNGVIGGLPDNF